MHVVGTLLRNLHQERRTLHCTIEFTLAKTKSVRFKDVVRLKSWREVFTMEQLLSKKILHSTIFAEVIKILAKETYLLSQIGCKNIVGVPGAYDKPVPIMMGYLEFSFLPFGRDVKMN